MWYSRLPNYRHWSRLLRYLSVTRHSNELKFLSSSFIHGGGVIRIASEFEAQFFSKISLSVSFVFWFPLSFQFFTEFPIVIWSPQPQDEQSLQGNGSSWWASKKLEQNPFPKILKLNVLAATFSWQVWPATLHNAPSGNFTEIATFSFLYQGYTCTNNYSGTVGFLIPDTLITVASLSFNSAQ